MRKFLLIFLVVLLGGLIFCGGCWFKKEKPLSFTGTIEATITNLSPEVTAKVIRVTEEGTQVKKGEIVAELEKTEFEILLNKAKANLEFYTNKLSQAQKAYEYQTHITAENIKLSKARLSEAEVTLRQAKKDLHRSRALFEKGAIAKRNLETAENTFQVAKATLSSQKALLSEALASSKQDIIKQQEIKATTDLRAQAQAELDRAREYLGYTKILAPSSGWVNKKILEVGELATPATPVVTLINLDDMWIEVFVPENQIGKIKLGNPAVITVDSFPNEKFSGKVIFISNQAEFTPKNIQTKEERVTLVYRIKVKVENPQQKLKPGTPADVVVTL